MLTCIFTYKYELYGYFRIFGALVFHGIQISIPKFSYSPVECIFDRWIKRESFYFSSFSLDLTAKNTRKNLSTYVLSLSSYFKHPMLFLSFPLLIYKFNKVSWFDSSGLGPSGYFSVPPNSFSLHSPLSLSLSLIDSCLNLQDMDELKQKLLYTTLELESARVQADEEMKKNEEFMKQLLQLLKLACQERDEARDQVQKLLAKLTPSTPPPEFLTPPPQFQPHQS